MQKKISKQFPKSSTKEIILALEHDAAAAVTRIAEKEARRQLKKIRESCNTFESGFVAIHLGE